MLKVSQEGEEEGEDQVEGCYHHWKNQTFKRYSTTSLHVCVGVGGVSMVNLGVFELQGLGFRLLGLIYSARLLVN